MSQKDPTKETINGKEYQMYPLSPSISMDLLTDLVAVISPIVAPILGAIFKGKPQEDQTDILDREINADMFAGAIGKLDAPQLKHVRRMLISAFEQVTFVDGVKLEKTVEAFYLGNIGELMQWLIWGCKVQWGKSLSALVKDELHLSANQIIPESLYQST